MNGFKLMALIACVVVNPTTIRSRSPRSLEMFYVVNKLMIPEGKQHFVS